MKKLTLIFVAVPFLLLGCNGGSTSPSTACIQDQTILDPLTSLNSSLWSLTDTSSTCSFSSNGLNCNAPATLTGIGAADDANFVMDLDVAVANYANGEANLDLKLSAPGPKYMYIEAHFVPDTSLVTKVTVETYDTTNANRRPVDDQIVPAITGLRWVRNGGAYTAYYNNGSSFVQLFTTQTNINFTPKLLFNVPTTGGTFLMKNFKYTVPGNCP